ncbi:unnamed protein product [Polarella glacialis]|uniref:Exostosin GT47 domain-containing protein n=3 Tax=Polarella glacialis TaxID=89957 RepID=A0A813GWL6_POLGL|nr:unnamed protein product [Polarella glacialis]
MVAEVLPDLDNALQDCAFGVISLILMTLSMTDYEEGIDRARELQALADRLYFQFYELLEDSDWPLEISNFEAYRLLLGRERNSCSGSKLKVFIYNTSREFSNHRLRTGVGMMGAASQIHAYLESGSCLTDDPDLADLFFVPAYHGVQYNDFLEVKTHEPDVEKRFPYLARHRGMDHFFVVSANLPSWETLHPLRHVMQLTVESYQVNDNVPRWYSPWKDVMIPGYIDRWRIKSMRSYNKPTSERGFLLVFHGNHPGTHKLYVTHKAKVRTAILDAFTGIPDCSVGAHVPDFFDRMGRSHFCLVPRGSSAWTIHLYESFFFGCVPVILSDFLEVPFQRAVDWPALSIKWPEDRVGPELLEHLRAIPLERIAEMKRRLEEAACYFDFHRGWGVRKPEDPVGWMSWSPDAVALGEDCDYLSHGDASSADSCRGSCDKDPHGCNLVNFLQPGSPQSPSGEDEKVASCVLRLCRDPAQPALTGGAAGWQVWSKVSDEALGCSPYAAIFEELEARRLHRPVSHGPLWN